MREDRYRLMHCIGEAVRPPVVSSTALRANTLPVRALLYRNSEELVSKEVAILKLRNRSIARIRLSSDVHRRWQIHRCWCERWAQTSLGSPSLARARLSIGAKPLLAELRLTNRWLIPCLSAILSALIEYWFDYTLHYSIVLCSRALTELCTRFYCKLLLSLVPFKDSPYSRRAIDERLTERTLAKQQH